MDDTARCHLVIGIIRDGLCATQTVAQQMETSRVNGRKKFVCHATICLRIVAGERECAIER